MLLCNVGIEMVLLQCVFAYGVWAHLNEQTSKYIHPRCNDTVFRLFDYKFWGRILRSANWIVIIRMAYSVYLHILSLPVCVRQWAFRWELFVYTLLQPGKLHLCVLLCSFCELSGNAFGTLSCSGLYLYIVPLIFGLTAGAWNVKCHIYVMLDMKGTGYSNWILMYAKHPTCDCLVIPDILVSTTFVARLLTISSNPVVPLLLVNGAVVLEEEYISFLTLICVPSRSVTLGVTIGVSVSRLCDTDVFWVILGYSTALIRGELRYDKKSLQYYAFGLRILI